MFRTRTLPLFLLLGLASTTLAKPVAVVSSDFRLLLKESEVEKELLQEWTQLSGRESVQFADPNLSLEDLPIKMQGLSADFDYDIQLPREFVVGSEFYLRPGSFSVQGSIPRVHADGYITRKKGPLSARIHLAFDCSGVSFELKTKEAPLTGLVRSRLVGEWVEITVPWLGVHWSPSEWEIKVERCKGPKGMEQFIVQEIQNYLSNTHQIAEQLQKEVQTKVQSLVDGWRKRTLNQHSWTISTGDIESQVRLLPQTVLLLEGGKLALAGKFSVDFGTQENGPPNSVHHSFPEGSGGKALPQGFSLPLGILDSLIRSSARSGLWTQDFLGQENEGFREFLSSRFKLALVWPDLSNFNPETPIFFETKPFSDPKMFGSWTTKASGELERDFEVDLKITMRSQRGGVSVTPLFFSAKLKGTAVIALEGASLLLKTRNLQLPELEPFWYLGYVQKFGANKLLDSEKIRKEVSKSLTLEAIEIFEFPQMIVGEGGEFSFVGLKLHNNLLTLPVIIRPLKSQNTSN